MSLRGNPAWTRLSMISWVSSGLFVCWSAAQPNASALQVAASTIAFPNMLFSWTGPVQLQKRYRFETVRVVGPALTGLRSGDDHLGTTKCRCGLHHAQGMRFNIAD